MPLSVVRSLPGGVDSRCYANGGQPVPTAPPGGQTVWLRPEELGNPADASNVTRWPDAGPYGNDAVYNGRQTPPVFVAPAGGRLPAVQFGINKILEWPYHLPLGDAFTVYVAATLRSAFTSRLQGPSLTTTFPLGRGPCDYTQGYLRYNDSLNTVNVPLGFLSAGPYIGFTRRSGPTGEVRLVGVDGTLFGLSPPGPVEVIALNVTFSGTQTTLFTWVSEVLVYPWRLDDDEHNAVLAYLAGRAYALPP